MSKSLPNAWLPTVIAIRESKDLTKMSVAALFGKLLEYESDATNSFDFHDESNKKTGTLLSKHLNPRSQSQKHPPAVKRKMTI